MVFDNRYNEPLHIDSIIYLIIPVLRMGAVVDGEKCLGSPQPPTNSLLSHLRHVYTM